MISGIALAAKQINPATKIIAVEPRGKELGPCLKAKQRLWSNPPQFIDTIAEGIKTQQVILFLQRYLENWFQIFSKSKIESLPAILRFA